MLASATAPNVALLRTRPLRFTTLRPNLWTARRPVHLALDTPILECSSAIAPNAARLRTLPLRFTTLNVRLPTRRMLLRSESRHCAWPPWGQISPSAATAPNAAPLWMLPVRFTTLKPNLAFKCQTFRVCHCRVTGRLLLRLPAASSHSSLEELYQESDARS